MYSIPMIFQSVVKQLFVGKQCLLPPVQRGCMLKRGGPGFVVPTSQRPSRPVKKRLVAKITTVLQRVPLMGNLSRQKFIAQFGIGLIKSRNVPFCEVTQHLNDAAKPTSDKTRIQRFFRDVEPDHLVLSQLLASLLPATGKLCLGLTV